MNQRPIIKIEERADQRFINFLGFGLLIISIFYIAYNYSSLPLQIPQHFNIKGEVDRYGHKAMLWLLPAIGLMMSLLIGILSKFPHIFNYPVQITENNAAKQYEIALDMLNKIRFDLNIIFTYMSISIVNISKSESELFNPYFLAVLISLIFINVGYGLYQAIKNK